MALPAAAAAAYQSIANMAGASATASPAAAAAPGGSFSDFLSGAVKDTINTIGQGEQAATAQVTGKSNIVDVVNSVNAAELSLDTVVAVRDKVVAAYQAIMSMPI
ncbi:MAG TPA: flagellar hook-basal body complex protein FliE [Rhizomicrobium sp.]|jgi:flagellar hook-basal body complex protein FliE|nr:flagellar hook-basal body complex protein FliE [Rhizomicrobium sp.]